VNVKVHAHAALLYWGDADGIRAAAASLAADKTAGCSASIKILRIFGESFQMGFGGGKEQAGLLPGDPVKTAAVQPPGAGFTGGESFRAYAQ
jgi:hypothetical protein